MNERIKELADQCWYIDTDTGEEKFSRTKFAELIVNECTDAIQQVSLKYKDGGETEEFMAGHYAASLLARVKIKQLLE